MPRHSTAARRDLGPAAPTARRARPVPLADAGSVDLISMRLVLREHLDELRQRGVDERVLRPIEAELRRFDQIVDTVDSLVEQQQP